MNKKKACLGIIVVCFLALAIIGTKTGNNKSDNAASPGEVKSEQKAYELTKVKTYKPGHYKVGKDLPAGEYVALSNGDAYISVQKDSKGISDSIIFNVIFINRSMVTVSDGQYLEFRNCTLYPVDDAPKVELKDGFLLSGMYKVGKDIAAGEYKIIAEGGGSSFVEVSKSSRHTVDDWISSDTFDYDKYITIEDGQYIEFYRAKIKVK